MLRIVRSLPAFLLASTLSAQTVQRITYADAIQIALRQNLLLRQAENNLQLQQAAASQAKKQLLPSFNFGTTASNNVGQQFNQTIGKLTTQNTQSVSPGVSTGLTLFDGTRTYANISSANHNASATEADLSRARQTAVFNAASFFITYLGAESQRSVQRENLAAVDTALKQIETRVAVGDKPRPDLYAQRALLAGARFALAQADQVAEGARLDLIQSLQLDPDAKYDFVAPDVQAEDTVALTDAAVDSLVHLARARRPDVTAARERLVAAGADSRAATAGRFPTITFGLSYGTNYTSASDSGLWNQFDQRRGGGANINFQLPIFDRGNTSLNQQRTRVAEENAGLAMQDQERRADLEVRRAAMTLRSASEQLAAAIAQESSARLALDGAEERYRTGAAGVSLVEVTQARSTLVAAQMALATARYNVKLMQTALAYYTGSLDMPVTVPRR